MVLQQKAGAHVITRGNVDDRRPLSPESFIRSVLGKLYADRGYISRKPAEILFVDGIHFVTEMRNSMKGGELPLQDRLMLRKRAVIESVNEEFKNICRIDISGTDVLQTSLQTL
jgi:hypothetical protein